MVKNKQITFQISCEIYYTHMQPTIHGDVLKVAYIIIEILNYKYFLL